MPKPPKPPSEPTLYTPSPEMAERLDINRHGRLTRGQRLPIVLAGLGSAIFFLCPALMLFSISVSTITGREVMVGVLGWVTWFILWVATFVSFGFLAIVLWTNAKMFLPEALSRHPVRWLQAPLAIKMAERDRPEMPFSYMLGSYSFAPFIAAEEVPLEVGREYVVYYTPRSRLLLSIAPADQPNSSQWMPTEQVKKGS